MAGQGHDVLEQASTIAGKLVTEQSGAAPPSRARRRTRVHPGRSKPASNSNYISWEDPPNAGRPFDVPVFHCESKASALGRSAQRWRGSRAPFQGSARFVASRSSAFPSVAGCAPRRRGPRADHPRGARHRHGSPAPTTTAASTTPEASSAATPSSSGDAGASTPATPAE